MIYEQPTGKRQLISMADALMIAQLSSFERPDLSEPSLDDNASDPSRISTHVGSVELHLPPECPVRWRVSASYNGGSAIEVHQYGQNAGNVLERLQPAPIASLHRAGVDNPAAKPGAHRERAPPRGAVTIGFTSAASAPPIFGARPGGITNVRRGERFGSSPRNNLHELVVHSSRRSGPPQVPKPTPTRGRARNYRNHNAEQRKRSIVSTRIRPDRITVTPSY
jgi:hypothetical protein